LYVSKPFLYHLTYPLSVDDKMLMLTDAKCHRILLVPIVNRQSDTVTMKLFGHPNILYLPSKLTGTLLYQTVDRVVPCLAYYSIHLTDGQVGCLHFYKDTCRLMYCHCLLLTHVSITPRIMLGMMMMMMMMSTIM